MTISKIGSVRSDFSAAGAAAGASPASGEAGGRSGKSGGLVDAAGKPLSKSSIKKLAKDLGVQVSDVEAMGSEEVNKLLAAKAAGAGVGKKKAPNKDWGANPEKQAQRQAEKLRRAQEAAALNAAAVEVAVGVVVVAVVVMVVVVCVVVAGDRGEGR